MRIRSPSLGRQVAVGSHRRGGGVWGRSQPWGHSAKQLQGWRVWRVWRRGFPEEVSFEQGTNNLKRKMGRSSAKALRLDPRGGTGLFRDFWAVGSLDLILSPGREDFCKLKRARSQPAAPAKWGN